MLRHAFKAAHNQATSRGGEGVLHTTKAKGSRDTTSTKSCSEWEAHGIVPVNGRAHGSTAQPGKGSQGRPTCHASSEMMRIFLRDAGDVPQ